MNTPGQTPRASGIDAHGDAGKPVGPDSRAVEPPMEGEGVVRQNPNAPLPIERRFEEVIDRYLHETGQDQPVSTGTDEPLSGDKSRSRDNALLRDASRGVRSHSSIYQRMRRNVRPSPYLLSVMVAALLSLLIWLGILMYTFDVDPSQPFAQFTLIRMQQALVLACTLSLLSSALLIRAAWQIWRGTRRYREFPPRRPAFLRPPAIVRGIDAERSGSLCLWLALAQMFGSACLVAGTLSMILRYV